MGTLPFAHLARCAFIAITFLREAVEFNIISEEACNEFLSQIRTVSHDLTSDAKKVISKEFSWESFVQKYGHLRPGTYDITSQRYDQDPDTYLKPMLDSSKNTDSSRPSVNAWDKEKDKC